MCIQAEAEKMPREERSRWKRQRKLKMRREQEGRSRGRIKQEGGEKRAGAGMPQSSGQGSKRAASSFLSYKPDTDVAAANLPGS